jgi:hypothetical protein
MDENCEFKNGRLIYKGYDIGLTMENIQDYKFQTGMEPRELIEYLYKNNIQVIRDNKINQILDE